MVTEEVKREIYLQVTLWVTSLVLLTLELQALTHDSYFKFDFFFLLALLWGLFFFRYKVKLHPLHYFLFAIFLVIHNLGVYGAYNEAYFSIEYDYIVHLFFGVVSSLIIFRAYKEIHHKMNWFTYVTIVTIILGFSAFHEVAEFAGAKILGPGEGFLFEGENDMAQYDTQIDLLNNLLGSIGGLVGYGIVIKILRRRERIKRKMKRARSKTVVSRTKTRVRRSARSKTTKSRKPKSR